MADYSGHGVIVTGAAGGIGRAIGEAYLARGASVTLVDSRPVALREVVAAWQDSWRQRVCLVAADVRRADDVEAALDRAFAAFPKTDILVNAAGIYPSHPVLDMTEQDWDDVLDTNLKGPFLTTQGFAKRLVDGRRRGVVVNITSGAASRARPGAAHYATSKAGLTMLTRAFALELARHGIRVNAVSPGFVAVNSPVNVVSPEYVEAIERTIPLGRSGTPMDIASAVLFVTSEAAAWMTGAIIAVDGGSGAGTLTLPLSRPRAP